MHYTILCLDSSMKVDPEEHYTIKELLYPDSEPQCLQTVHACTQAPGYLHEELEKEKLQSTEMSRAIWMSNPGYLHPDPKRMTSIMRQDFVWDKEEIESMKEKGLFLRSFNRKRDDFTEYVEAQAKIKKLM